MIHLAVDVSIQDGDWAQYIDPNRAHIDVPMERIGVIENGMASGKPSVVVLGHDANGTAVSLQTSYAALMTAVAALRGRHGDV